MKLYHGSLEIVDHPEIRKAVRTLDYGDGFYATTSFQQAEAWVRRRAKENMPQHLFSKLRLGLDGVPRKMVRSKAMLTYTSLTLVL